MIVQILLKLPVVIAEIRPLKQKKQKIKIVHVFGSAFGSVSAHVWKPS